jgi:hypothetical protein
MPDLRDKLTIGRSDPRARDLSLAAIAPRRAEPRTGVLLAPAATVVISTRNRKPELRRAIQSCLTQSVPVEVVVRDDGSTDGTGHMVQTDFPWVVYQRSPRPMGSIANRNLAVRAARTAVIFSLDDDAAFTSPFTVEQTLRELDHPRVAAVGIPFIDVAHGPQVLQRAPDSTHIYAMPCFRGCAAAWRRDVFLSLGGYSEVLFHMAEEPCFCMRLLGAGFITRLGSADPIVHYESPNRNKHRVVSLNVRNGILMGILNAPGLMMPVHALGSTIRSLRSSLPRRHVPQTLHGIGAALTALPPAFRSRKALPRDAYFLYRRLLSHGPQRLHDILNHLPPMAFEPPKPAAPMP